MINIKRLVICIFVVASHSSANSQITEERMVHFAIEQYIAFHFDTTSEQFLYIETLDDNQYGSFKCGEIKVVFFDSRKEKYFYKKAIKKSGGHFLTLSKKQQSNDTIDFRFCKCHVNKIGSYFNILMESGGDAGYLPSARFIYNKMEEKWFYYSAQELMKRAPFEEIKKGKVTESSTREKQ